MSDLTRLLSGPVPSWGTIALSYNGRKEIPGPQNEPQLMELIDMGDGKKDGKAVGADDDDEAWCAKGMCGAYELAGIRSPRTARARDFLGWGQELEFPALWCTVVLERGPDFGHVTYAVGRTAGNDLIGYGFNQQNGATFSAFDPQRILGYRYPPQIQLPPRLGFLSLPVLDVGALQRSRNEA